MENAFKCLRIQQELKKQGRSLTWFSKEIGMDISNVYKLFRRNTIDLSLLIRISILLKYNFLQDCADAVYGEIFKK